MLRMGIQKPLQTIAPPKSEREVYDEQFKEAEHQLLGDEARKHTEPQRKRQREGTENESSAALSQGAVPDPAEENPLNKL
jgi:hypothetical protein